MGENDTGRKLDPLRRSSNSLTGRRSARLAQRSGVSRERPRSWTALLTGSPQVPS